MQEFTLKLLDKLPNRIIGVPKLKSYVLNKFNGEILKFCSLTENLKIELNLSDSSENYLWFGCKPNDTISFLSKNLCQDSIFVDCGANIGLWSLIALENIKGEGNVYSFEPNPKLFKRLKKNLEFNNVHRKCNSYQLGLSSKSNSAFLYLDENHHQMGSLHNNTKKNKIYVELRTLDSFRLDRIDGIKLDVEGHELEVIKGALRTITKHRPWLVIELNNSFCGIQNISQWRVYKLLNKIGYMTNFNKIENLNSSFCRDIIFYDSAYPNKEQFPPFL